MVSAIYANILALLIVWLSLQVIKLRRAKKVILGEGGETDLHYAIRAQGNDTEYIPIPLILLILLELSGGAYLVGAFGGIALIIGRVLHAQGLLKQNMRFRVLGMQFTLFTIIGLASGNILYGISKFFV
jgi:uncharacterized protein